MTKFGSRSTADEVLEALDLTGKTFLVTGCASGLGLETMRALAARGGHVVGTARTLARATQACANVSGHTTPLACEQDDFSSVISAASRIRELGLVFDAIIANAGIMATPKPDARYGVEAQFRVNHLSHMLLVTRIIDLVRDHTGRLVVLSSAAQMAAPGFGIDFDNLDGRRGYKPWRFYGQSKLANLAFARSMAERLAGRGITSNALHPGMIAGTNLARSLGPGSRLLLPLARLLFKSVPQGAATQCYLAAHPEVAGATGGYYSDCRPAKSHPRAADPQFCDRLWSISESILSNNSPAL